MKLQYDAKYEYFEVTPFEAKSMTYVRRLQATRILMIIRSFLWLIVFLWAGGLAYFLVYPLLPDLQEARMKTVRYDPYTLGYSMTTRLFTSLIPPVSDIEDLEFLASQTERTLEYVDPEGVEIADLEAKGTVLSIPSANIQGRVVDGLNQDAMMRGFWHYPLSSVPGKRGNLVFIGHRFAKLPPSTDTFFHLDKIAVGDKITVSQGDENWTYTVISTRIVEKDDASVLASSGEYRLTLITCTPLWTARQRLVVTAVLEKVSNVI